MTEVQFAIILANIWAAAHSSIAGHRAWCALLAVLFVALAIIEKVIQ